MQKKPSDLAKTLKSRRLDKKLAKHKVAKILNLPEETITAIEDSNDTSIPGSHLPGIARKYGVLLGIEEAVETLLDQYESASGEGVKRRPKSAESKTLYFAGLVRVMVVGFVILVIGGYAVWQIGQLGASPSLSISVPVEGLVVESPELVLDGAGDQESTVLVNGDPITLDDEGNFETIIYLQKGFNSLEVSAINSFSRATTLNRTVYFQ